jgi:hypothetical protein
MRVLSCGGWEAVGCGFSHAAASTPLGSQDAQAAPVCRDFLKVRPVGCALPVLLAELGSLHLTVLVLSRARASVTTAATRTRTRVAWTPSTSRCAETSRTGAASASGTVIRQVGSKKHNRAEQPIKCR